MKRQKRVERDPSRAVTYCRVSTQEQAQGGLSLDAQRRELESYAKARGLSIEGSYVDAGRSATTDARPEFQRMMSEVLSPSSRVGQLLVIHGTRFMRDSHLAAVYRAKLKRVGVQLVATQQPEGEGPMGELMDHLMDGLAQFESQTIGIRARSGMAESARNGFYPHPIAPFGYRIQKVEFRGRHRNRLEVDREEAAVVEEIFTLYENQHGGLAIAQNLNRAGKLRRGRSWTRDSVLKTLGCISVTGSATWGRREARTGRLRPESEWIRIEVEPIIALATFKRVQSIRAERDPVKNPGRASSSTLLLGRGLARCGHCGSSLELQTSGKKQTSGDDYRYYHCRKARREGREACPCAPIRADELDDEVVNQIFRSAFAESRARKILEHLCSSTLRQTRTTEIARLRRLVEQAALRRARLIDALAEGTVCSADIEGKLRALMDNQKKHEQELNLLRATLPPKAISRALVKRFLRRCRQALNGEEFRRSYVRNVASGVVLTCGLSSLGSRDSR